MTKKDPLGNPQGTIRAILALMFSATMCVIAGMHVYRAVVLNLPVIAPDDLTIAIFLTGSTLIGAYFGLRTRQMAGKGGIAGLALGAVANAEDAIDQSIQKTVTEATTEVPQPPVTANDHLAAS